MEPKRTGHDALHKASTNKLDETNSMKKECASVRKSFKKYLRGHVFKLEKIRIERHLKSCAVCSSELQALKRVDETRQLIRDITPPEGVVQRVKEGVSGLAKLRKLFYRPLWIAAIIGVAAAVYINVIAPNRRDVEIENIEKSLPPATPAAAPAASAPTVTTAPAAAPATPAAPQASPKPAPAREPLAVTITPENETAIRQINEALRGQGALKKMKFSDTVRELSGSLTTEELLALFDKIGPAGKVSYSRKRFATFPSAEPVPFILKLKPAPISAAQPSASTSASAPPATHRPAEAPAAANPSSAPTQTPLP